MSQIRCLNITVGHGTVPLIVSANLTIERGEKVCIIGRNGVGKSTFLRALMGQQELDSGVIEKSDTLSFAFLEQTFPNHLDSTVFEIASRGLKNKDLEDWEKQHRVEKVLSRLELDGEAQFDSLSGGLKRRVLLAKALITEPDVLLLDEPTNHLDIDAINWLENFLVSYHPTVIFITHDRSLTQNLATHIVEVDNGKLLSWQGRYHDFLKHKEHLLEVEARENTLFDKKLAEEEVWIRKGIKARRTRNEGRVRILKKMREQRADRRVRSGTVNLAQHDVKLSGKIVFDVDNVSYSYDDKPIIKNFSTVIMRGDKIGIIGANGSGKSTLLNLLLDKLEPDTGTVKHGTKLEIAYFDQQHIGLDDSKTVQDNVGEGSEQVTIDGNTKHIMGYLQDFLFSPERARQPVKYLSGGERNRVMLAKLFLKPCNVLVMDEPTNDLDVETLELLEEQLANFKGTLLLVSHDRTFLNNIVSSIIVLKGDAEIDETIGGYDDWLELKKSMVQAEKKVKGQEKPAKKTSKKLSYNDQRELSKLPAQIESLEKKQKVLHEKLADPELYQKKPEELARLQTELQQMNSKIEVAYARWDELEDKKN